MKARYNYRIYPKQSQLVPLAKAFGSARVVWNDALWLYKQAFKEEKELPKNISKIVTTDAKKTKKRYWLAEVSSVILQQSVNDLKVAWKSYFDSKKGKRKGKKVGKPKWKKKQSRQAIRFTKNAFKMHSESVELAKIGHVKMIVSRPLPSKPSSVTIVKDCADRYFASFVVEVSQPIPPQTDNSVGIDLGLTHFAILSNGEKVENPRLHKKMLRKIKKANRRLSKAKKRCDPAAVSAAPERAPRQDSNRRKRRKLKLAKLHAKVKDQRTDFLHKLTTRLVRENQTLAIEDLNVSGMVKNRKLSRAISDAGWSKFKTMLAAKCDKYGRNLTIVDRWYPSSQVCSCCGQYGGKKKLDVREWECLFCNTIHDRDINAAKNIREVARGAASSPLQDRRDAGGLSESSNGRGESVSLPMVAVLGETSTTYKQLTLF